MKLNLKPEATRLRRLGYSIADIAKKLKIAESTASLWCRKIQLTTSQQRTLGQRTNRKLERFFRIVKEQQLERKKAAEKLILQSSKATKSLSERDLFIAGIALYWAEGFKHQAEGRIGFCNSDPEMMKLIIKFLRVCFKIPTEDLSPRLTLNQSFKNNASEIEKFWSDNLKLPLSQFTKPFYQKTSLKKHYEHPENYHGVLRIHVRRSSKLLTEMRGYLEGLKLFAQQA